MYKNLIIDLDNTLCPCSQYYVDAQSDVVEYANAKTGVPKTILLNILKHIDGECTALPDGFNRTRFPRSFAAMMASAQIIAGLKQDVHSNDVAFAFGDAVFNQPYDLFDGAADMLRTYKASGFTIVLYTLGDYGVQRYKVEKNGLHEIFGEENIHIVPKKVGHALDEIIAKHGFVKSETVMIGDSLRGDIGSANDAGIDSVWISSDAHAKWHYENVDAKPTFTIGHVNELESVIPNASVNSWLL